jgi:hypothetical protein
MQDTLTEVQRDPAYLIIKERIPSDFQAKLFEHTRKLKAEQAEGFTTSLQDGKRYFVRKRGKSRRTGANTSPGVRSEQTTSWRRRRYTGTGRIGRAGSKDTQTASQERLELDAEMQKPQEERENLGRRPQDPVFERQDETVAETAESDREQDREKLQRKPISSSSQTQDIDHGDARNIDSLNDEDNARVHDVIVTSDDLSRQSSERRESSRDPATSRMKSMETMLLYRAMLFACLLATGTDTSDLLWLENRNRVVQVL